MKGLTIAAVLMGALVMPAGAQDFEDEPGQGVARLSLVTGNVTVQRGDSGEFIAGERNAPLVSQDHVITGENARAEIQFDWANMIRMAPDSEVRVAELRDGDLRLEVVEGTATFRVLRDSSVLVEISTPAISIRPLEKGVYRIMVRPDGSTEVTVRSGEAEIFTMSGSEVLRSGRTMEAHGDPNNLQTSVLSGIPRDEWDRWNETRDRDLERGDSYKYVSRDIYGADDLDGYGRWVYDSPYGWVWVPAVPATWAPYRAGRWAWVDYYGWTWVSSDPWGWAPYHYGRWYHGPRYGWVWYPGPVGPRHYWRPALVAFFGWGSGAGVNVTFGFGNVGWVPLAPYEVYRPWYGRHARTNVTVNNVTIVSHTNIINTYRNARFRNGRNGATSVSARDFGHNRVTLNNFVRVTDRDLNRGREVRGRMPFEPTRESRQFSDRTVTTRNTFRANDDRQFVRNQQQGRRVETPRGANANAGTVTQPSARGRQGQNNNNRDSATRRLTAPDNQPGNGRSVSRRSDPAPQNNAAGGTGAEPPNNRGNGRAFNNDVRRAAGATGRSRDAARSERRVAPASGAQAPSRIAREPRARPNSPSPEQSRAARPEAPPAPEVRRAPAVRPVPRMTPEGPTGTDRRAARSAPETRSQRSAVRSNNGNQDSSSNQGSSSGQGNSDNAGRRRGRR